MLPSSFLFLVAPSHLKCASSCLCTQTSETETSPSGSPLKSHTIGCILHSSLPKGEAPSCVSHCVLCHRTSGVAACHFFVLTGPEKSRVSWAHPHSEVSKTKASPSGSPLKIQNVGDMLHSFFLSHQKRLLSCISLCPL